MEDYKKPSNVQVALRNGLILGAVLIVFSLFLYVLGVSHDSKIQYLSFIILIIGAVMGIKQWRDKYNDGYLSYGQAFLNGFLTLLFSGIVASIWTLIFFGVIAPGELENILRATEEQMYEANPNLTDEQFDMAMRWTGMMMRPGWMAFWGLLANVFAGLIISLIVAIFMKKEKPFFEE
jgi:hypothetical protein